MLFSRPFRHFHFRERRTLSFLLGITVVLLVSGSLHQKWTPKQLTFHIPEAVTNTPELRSRLLEARILLVEAHRKARRIQTRFWLRHVLFDIDRQLSRTNKTDMAKYNRKKSLSIRLPEYCPEVRKPGDENQPDKPSIYQTTKCEHQPLNEIVTFLINPETFQKGCDLATRIHSIYPYVPIIMATNKSNALCGQNVHLYGIPNPISEVDIWYHMAQRVRTKYVLIGRNMVDFTEHTNVDRLIRVLSEQSLDIVGGAVRLEPEGLWSFGCYQVVMQNFTLRFRSGHDRSIQSCAFCDYIDSPFLVRRSFFLTHWQERMSHHVLSFVDLFLHLIHNATRYREVAVRGAQMVACVDVIFHVAGYYSVRDRGLSDTPRSIWLRLARKWTLSRIILPGNIELNWKCLEVNIDCSSFTRPGYIVPFCCLQELGHCLVTFLQFASTNNLTTCLTTASLANMIKMSGTLAPWTQELELYWDVYQLKNFVRFARDTLNTSGQCVLSPVEYLTVGRDKTDQCVGQLHSTCLRYTIKSVGWKITLTGVTRLICTGGVHPTRVGILGHWVPTVWNPGLYLRKLYGDDVLIPFINPSDDFVDPLLEEAGLNASPDRSCRDTQPMHACLHRNFDLHGTLQFKDILAY